MGQLTAQRSVQQVQAMMAQYARALYGVSAESTVPLVSLEDIIIAGHSMVCTMQIINLNWYILKIIDV